MGKKERRHVTYDNPDDNVYSRRAEGGEWPKRHWMGPMLQGNEMTRKVLFCDDLKAPGDGSRGEKRLDL